MHFNKIKVVGSDAAQLMDDGVVINSTQDALDMLVDANELLIVMKKEQLNPDFFDLRTGFAGDVMQKLVNYGVRVVVVGDFSNLASKSLRDFIYECNSSRSSGGGMRFVESLEDL